jgi:hypothetical protein
LWFLSSCGIIIVAIAGSAIVISANGQFSFGVAWVCAHRRLFNFSFSANDPCLFNSFSGTFRHEVATIATDGGAGIIFFDDVTSSCCIAAIPSGRRNVGARVVVAITINRPHGKRPRDVKRIEAYLRKDRASQARLSRTKACVEVIKGGV